LLQLNFYDFDYLFRYNSDCLRHRYADRAKKIKNKAVVNENPMDKLIRELREENERLKKSMSGDLPVAPAQGMSPEGTG